MQRRHTGRPATAVIPADWEASHGAVTARTFDCTVAIGPAGGDPVWNPETGQTETPAVTPVYTGPAAIAAVTDSARLADTAGDQVPLRGYEITLDRDVDGITADHVVHVTSSPDPMLAGRTLVEVAIERGRRFTRVLLATLND